MRSIRLLFTPLVVLVAFVPASCGGGGVSTEDFAKEADPVCDAANTKLRGIAKPDELKATADASRSLASTNKDQARKIRALEQPDDSEAQVKAMLEAMDAVTAEADGLAKAVDEDDFVRVESRSKAMASNAGEADTAAREAGLARCGGALRDKANDIQSAIPELLKEDFIKRADLLCADANRKFESLEEPESERELMALIDQSLEINAKMVTDLRGLFVPEGERGAFEEILAANARAEAALREMRTAVEKGDEKQIETLGLAADEASADATKMADAFGFSDCGTPT